MDEPWKVGDLAISVGKWGGLKLRISRHCGGHEWECEAIEDLDRGPWFFLQQDLRRPGLLDAYVKESKLPDCHPDRRFRATLPDGSMAWFRTRAEAEGAVLGAVNGVKRGAVSYTRGFECRTTSDEI